MNTDTIDGTLEREDTHTNSELKLADVQAEIERQDEQIPIPAELAAMERQLKDGIAEFRAELDAVRRSGILNLHMPDGPEARRRRGLLAPLAAPQPGPYSELAPDKLAAEAAEAKRVRQQRRSIGWTPNAANFGSPEPDGWVADTRLRRTLAWIGSRRKRGV